MHENGIIDFHHHVYPHVITEAFERSGRTLPFALEWTPALSLEFMEKAGIARSVVSIDDCSSAQAGCHVPSQMARSCNEYLACLAAEYPQRFIPLATLPLPDVDAALRELEYAIGTLGLAGLSLMSNVSGVYLGSDGQEELFAECEKRRIPVMIHPSVPPAGVLDPLLEYAHDVTRAVANLVYRGVLERYPRLPLVLAQAGGTLPYLRDRVLAVGLESYIERQAFVPLLARYRRRRASLRRAYLELSGATGRFALATITGTVDSSRLLYGSGFPHCSVTAAIQAQRRIEALGSRANGNRLFAETMGSTKTFLHPVSHLKAVGLPGSYRHCLVSSQDRSLEGTRPLASGGRRLR